MRQGEDNIQDGISLIHVADGALDEVVSILQRLNETTIHALNDTLMDDDRGYIQMEVEKLKEEIASIAEKTTFNEMELLKGNPKRYVQITADQTVTFGLSKTVNVTAPSFLTVDGTSVSNLSDVDNYTISVHSSYTETQECSNSERMLVSNNPIDPPGYTDDEYWGGTEYPKPAELSSGATYNGNWSSTISDNYAVKIGFENLATCSDASALFNDMLGLLGTTIGSSCGTCSKEFAGLSYVGSVEGFSASMPEERARFYSDSALRPDAKLDISNMQIDDGTGTGSTIGVFEAINNLAAVEQGVAGTTSTYANASSLGTIIAKALSSQSVAAMQKSDSMTQHFSRVTQSSDGMGFVIYDYRDETVLSNEYPGASAPSLRLSSSMKMTVPSSAVVPGTWGYNEGPLKIVCSDGFMDNSGNSELIDHVPLSLPYLSLYELDLDNFNVADYKVTTKTTYSPEYLAKYNKWKAEADAADATYQAALQAYYATAVPVYQTITHPATDEVEEYMISRAVREIRFNDVGEKYWAEISPAVYGSRTIHYDAWDEIVQVGTTYTGTKPANPTTSPEPIPGPGDITTETVMEYIRPNIDKVKNALQKVLGDRAYLGATENRLRHAYNNNTNTRENTQSAESLIRDTDIASEMVNFNTSNILAQAGQSMLAQANQTQQGILSILQ